MATRGDALLILDMVSEFRFPDWQPILAAARRIAPRIEGLRQRARGGEVVRLLQPSPHDFFIFKPRHSGFYGTPLTELLERCRVGRLVLTGLTSHQCVLFTAVDAHVRNYDLVVPPDCIGAPRAAQSRYALQVLRDSLGAHTPRSSSLRFRPAGRRATG